MLRDVASELAEVVPSWLGPQPETGGLSASELRARKLERIEDELLETNLEILNDASCFAEIDADTPCPPQRWIDELGEARAMRKFRVARAAWMSAKEAPVALSLSKSITNGIMKARAAEKQGPRTLNVALVKMVVPANPFPEQELLVEEKR
jgi:hypothetical protein